MIFAVLMTVCMQSDGSSCHEERIEIRGQPMACIVQAQTAVAEWTGDHPGWKVTSWKCKPAG